MTRRVQQDAAAVWSVPEITVFLFPQEWGKKEVESESWDYE